MNWLYIVLAAVVVLGLAIFLVLRKRQPAHLLPAQTEPEADVVYSRNDKMLSPSQETPVVNETVADAVVEENIPDTPLETEVAVEAVVESPVAEVIIEVEPPEEIAVSEERVAEEAVEVAVASEAPEAESVPEIATADTAETIPEDSISRRHYLSTRQAEKDAITHPYPTDSVLRRHHSSL
jgi:hypothetical protein